MVGPFIAPEVFIAGRVTGEELDTRRQKITKAIADLSVETISQQHFAESAAPRTALLVGPFIAPEVFIARRVTGDF